MSKLEVLEKMMNSDNGRLYVTIGAIVTVFGIDCITKSHYRVEANKESLTVAPVEAANPEKPESAQ